MGWTFYDSSGRKLNTASTLIDNLDIDGATDIGAAIVAADLFIVDDGAGGTNRKTAASRIVTYVAANAQADAAACEAETDEDTYFPPDLMRRLPGHAKAWCQDTTSSGTADSSYNISGVTSGATGFQTRTYTKAMSSTSYCYIATTTDADTNACVPTVATANHIVQVNDMSGSNVDAGCSSLIFGDSNV